MRLFVEKTVLRLQISFPENVMTVGLEMEIKRKEARRWGGVKGPMGGLGTVSTAEFFGGSEEACGIKKREIHDVKHDGRRT